MTDLQSVPNIGPKAAHDLARAGISSLSQLRRIGSVGALRRIRDSGGHVCRSRLYALEGAVRGVRWHDLPAETRERLSARFRDL